eukprot:13791155-Ditylum_brightwellii.AAC.2
MFHKEVTKELIVVLVGEKTSLVSKEVTQNSEMKYLHNRDSLCTFPLQNISTTETLSADFSQPNFHKEAMKKLIVVLVEEKTSLGNKEATKKQCFLERSSTTKKNISASLQ